MSSVICFIVGLLIGTIAIYIIYQNILEDRDDLIDDLREAVKIHNKRELRLVYINQSTKDYVKEQINRLKKEHGAVKVEDAEEKDFMYAANYIAWKDIQQKIDQLEKDADNLIEQQNY